MSTFSTKRREITPEALERRDGRLLLLAVLTIAVSLAALVITPLLVQRRVDEIRSRLIEMSDSAVAYASAVEYALARDIGLLRGFFVEGDTVFIARYRDGRIERDEALTRLDELTQRLPAAVEGRLSEVQRLSYEWDAAVEAELAGGVRAAGSEPPLARPLYEETLQASAGLRQELRARRSAGFRAVEEAERLEVTLTVVLTLLALLSTALAVWLGSRIRRYAEASRLDRLRAVRSDESRLRLMRGVAHDLKSPLGAIMLYSDLLELGLHGSLTEGQQEIVGRLRSSGAQMLGLLDDLVELSMAQSGVLQLQIESIRVLPLLEAVRDQFVDVAATANIELRLEEPLELPAVDADPRRARQILDNLVGNAIKFTPRGGTIRIRTRVDGSGDGSGAPRWVQVSVIDSGPGVPSDQTESVFEEFVRLPAAGGLAGSGIGLAISRQLARLMRGEVTLSSEDGGGSTFTVWLPASRNPVFAPKPVPSILNRAQRAAVGSSEEPDGA
jgi:signal transduction histidine kinase